MLRLALFKGDITLQKIPGHLRYGTCGLRAFLIVFVGSEQFCRKTPNPADINLLMACGPVCCGLLPIILCVTSLAMLMSTW
jgi:hypothetical protein